LISRIISSGAPRYVSDVSVYYGSKCAVQNVSFNIHPGQLTAIIGNNGCGKTSLIKAVIVD